MTLLLLGMLLFISIHLIPALPSYRTALINRLGEAAYKGLFSLCALLGLLLIVTGKAHAEFIHIWSPPSWTRHATMLLVLFAFIALVVTYFPSNLKRWLRHPMLIAILLWAGGHLAVNGDLASLILFGGFALFATVALLSLRFRTVTVNARRYPILNDVLAVLLGIGVYALLLWLHPYLFGVAVIF